MEPREYLPAYLERVYRRNHPDLKPSAPTPTPMST